MSNARVELDPLDTLMWPCVDDIQDAQDKAIASRPNGLVRGDQGLWMDGDRVWIPPDAHELLMRLMIIAHNGHMGHRGHATTKNVLNTVLSILSAVDLMPSSRFFSTCVYFAHMSRG